jgi:phosphate starvation-inducible PhoH-like protein
VLNKDVSEKNHNLNYDLLPASVDLSLFFENTETSTMSKAKRRQREYIATVSDANLKPRNPLQAEFIKKIQTNHVTFGIGPAGTGKTFIASIMAARALDMGQVDRIILCRPIVQAAGEDLGFLPGTLQEKADPYLRPMMDAFNKYWQANPHTGQGKLSYLLEKEKIEVCPLAFMRGRDFERCWILCDEAQNMNEDMMKMLLTRVGSESRLVITGDPDQKDDHKANGFEKAKERLSDCPSVAFSYFGRQEIVRSEVVRDILNCWE